MVRKILKAGKLLLFKIKNSKLKDFKWKGYSFLNINTEFAVNSHISVGLVSVRNNCVIRVRDNASLIIGDNVIFNNNCIITCRDYIKIGENTIFGPNVLIFDNDHDYKSIDLVNNYKTSKIEIESNVWIGGNCIILRGTKIGHDSVIGAGCVIKGEIPPFSVVYQKQDLTIKHYDKEKEK